MKNESLSYDFHGKLKKIISDKKYFSMKNESLSYDFHGINQGFDNWP